MRRLLPLLLLAACAHSPVRGDIHEDGWLLVETAHVSLRTDLDRDDAVARARQLEQFWQALATHYAVVVPGAARPSGRFPVVHFDSCRDYRLVAPESTAGFVFTSRGYPRERIAVTCDDYDDTTLVHELAHIFNHHFFSSSLPWVNEGLATYYSTMTVQDGKVVIGKIPPYAVRFIRRAAWEPPLDQLRRMSYEEFRAGDQGRRYFGAWKLVHLLSNTTPELRARFRHYLAAIGAGATSDEAWDRAFAGLEAGALDEDYRRYQHRAELNVLKAAYSWPAIPAPRVTRLSAGEAHAVWAHLLVLGGPRGVAEQLERAGAVDPDWPDLLYWRAVLLRGRPAVGLLRQHLRRRPDDLRAWHALVSLRMSAAAPPSYLGLDGSPPSAIVAMEPDVLRLVERASTADALNTVGWYFALRQNPVTGLNFAIRAVRADPGCGACWDTVALLYFQAGKVAEAVAAQERAANLYAESVPRDVLVRLRRYRAALRRGTPPAGSGR